MHMDLDAFVAVRLLMHDEIPHGTTLSLDLGRHEVELPRSLGSERLVLFVATDKERTIKGPKVLPKRYPRGHV